MATSDNNAPALARLWADCYRPHLTLIIISLVFVSIYASVNGLYAPIVKNIVDGLQSEKPDLSWLFVAAFCVSFIKAGALLVSRRINVRIFSLISITLQKRMYDKMIAADMVWHAREPAAALTSRIVSDVGAVRTALQRVANSLIRDSLMLVAVVGSMFYIDWQLTLIAMAVFPVALLPIARIGHAIRKLSRSTQAHMAAISARLQESLAGIQFAKTYQLEDVLEKRAEQDLDELRRLQVRSEDHASTIDPMMEVLGGLAVVGVLFFVSWRIDSGVNTLGDFAGFVTALLLSGQPMRALANISAAIQRGLAAAERVYAVLDDAPKIVSAPGAPPLSVSEGRIEFDGVTFTYSGSDDGAAALANVSLTFEGGRRVALVGRSGAGKSTLFSLIPRLFDPTGGSIRIDGQDIRTVTVESLRQNIAIVSQEPILFNDTVANNIALGRSRDAGPPDRDAIVEAAKHAYAHDFIAELPNGYDSVVGDRGGTLSGGQRQRIAIARAFLRDAPILLLDEATSALDAEAESAIKLALDRLAVGRTTIVIAHRMSTILDADLIVVLDNGHIVQTGTHSELRNVPGIYASFLEKQFATEAA